MPVSKELWAIYVKIFFVELAYWVVSISMVFINENVLNDKLMNDDLTIFVTIFQIIFSLSILLTLNYITRKCFLNQPKKRIAASDGDKIYVSIKDRLIDDEFDDTPGETDKTQDNDPDSWVNLFYVDIPHRINIETSKTVFPLSVLYIGMLLLNNFCLKSVGVAFYFVSRSLTTVFNVAFTYLLINEPVSKGALICCASIIFGFILGIDQESVLGDLSVMGVVYGVSSSLFTSLCSIYTKKTLAKVDKNIWVLVLYNNINAIVLCTPLLIVHGDVQALVSEQVISPTFWVFLSISGVMSFFISIVTNASIKYTSPLTHNISGTAKACLQTVIAVIFVHEYKPTLWWISNIIILIASAAYSRIKQLEMESRSIRTGDLTMRKDSAKPSTSCLARRDSASSSGTESGEVLFEMADCDKNTVKTQQFADKVDA